MKYFFNLLWIFPAVAAVLTGCQSEGIAYSGPEYVAFSDTIYTMPILSDESAEFDVTVAATTTVDYDRNYAVEMVNEKSTAVRGLHFDFVDNSQNIVIKAGERTANVKLKGHYEKVGRNDSLVVSLRLVSPESQKWDLYGDQTRVDFVKCPPFKMNDFLMIDKDDAEVNMKMYASFPFSEQETEFSAVGKKKDETTLIITDMFGSSSEKIRVIFDDSDPLNPTVIVPEQAAFREANYGYVWVRSVDQYPSYYNSFDSFFVLILDAYVPQLGSFGVYRSVFKCISQDEAENGNNGAVTRSLGDNISVFNFRRY